MGRRCSEVSACCFIKYSQQKPQLWSDLLKLVLFSFCCVLANHTDLTKHRALASDTDEHQTFKVCQYRNDNGNRKLLKPAGLPQHT